MKKLIITTFVLGLSTSAFADGGLETLNLFSFEETQTTSVQPQVGSSRDKDFLKIEDNYQDLDWDQGFQLTD